MGMEIKRMERELIQSWEWEKITAYCNYSKLCNIVIVIETPGLAWRKPKTARPRYSKKLQLKTTTKDMGSKRKSVLQMMYTVARQVLCVPVCSAASESI